MIVSRMTQKYVFFLLSARDIARKVNDDCGDDDVCGCAMCQNSLAGE